MSALDCPRTEQNAKRCTCTYAGCPRHGVCCECLHYHRGKNELPACYFSPEAEKAYNRSIDFFIKSRRG